MSTKRRDNKGRILRDGELQRKDGKYEYRYTDQRGGRHSVYSWRLVETDQTPAGKKKQPPLREIEKKIQRDLDDGINLSRASQITLNQYYEEYIALKKNLKPTSLAGYKRNYNAHVKETLGRKNIASIKYSDVKSLYISLIGNDSSKHTSISAVHTVLNQVFKAAVRDEIIRNNYASDAYAEVSKMLDRNNDKRHALTIQEQDAFLKFVRNRLKYEYWNPLFTTLLGTGMRIGEAAGLTWDDVDFTDNIIYIRKNLQRVNGNNGDLFISTPKTKSGIRIIPMFEQVKKVLLDEKKRQMMFGKSTFEVDGYKDFVFFTKQGSPIGSYIVNSTISSIVYYHNISSKDIQLPKFTAHTLRHTFCTRMCENESNIKVIQEIMGHSDISMTMNIYAEATKDKKVEVFKNLEGKIAL